MVVSRIINNLALVSVFLALQSAAAQSGTGAEGYCSLIVRVEGPDRLPLVAQVGVQDSMGRRLSKRTLEDGTAAFCDLGIKPADIVVGKGGCGEVELRNVSLVWGKTKIVPILYAPCWLKEEPPYDPTCSILLRFANARGEPVRGVRVQTQFGRHESLSDVYGRMLIGVGIGKTIEGTAAIAGFQNEQFSVSCSASDQRIEREIRMVAATP